MLIKIHNLLIHDWLIHVSRYLCSFSTLYVLYHRITGKLSKKNWKKSRLKRTYWLILRQNVSSCSKDRNNKNQCKSLGHLIQWASSEPRTSPIRSNRPQRPVWYAGQWANLLLWKYTWPEGMQVCTERQNIGDASKQHSARLTNMAGCALIIIKKKKLKKINSRFLILIFTKDCTLYHGYANNVLMHMDLKKKCVH